MKKALVIFFAVFLISGLAFAQGQDQGDIRIHTLGTYDLRFNDFGLGGGIEFFFAEHFALMPSYTWIFPEVGNRSNFSADLRYYISDGPSQLYFMAGYSQNWEDTQPGTAGTRTSRSGANAGVGAYIRLTEWMGLSTEFKIQSQSPSASGFRLGLAFPL
jgi:hypothetical protein